MTGSVILDVVIGLVFVYLLYSLFATIIQEIVATHLRMRAKILEKALIRMLEDGKSASGNPKKDRREGWKALLFKTEMADEDMHVVNKFYKHPLIKYLAEDNKFHKPSYINASNFSKVMVDMFRGPGLNAKSAEVRAAVEEGRITDITDSTTVIINKETTAYLHSIWVDAKGDVDQFRLRLEKWFDDTMERASGWYKKYTQTLLFIIGICLAGVFNVDTVQLAKNLSRDPKLREQIVDAATTYAQKNADLKERVANDAKLQADLKPELDEIKKRADDLSNKAHALFEDDIKNTNSMLAIGWSGIPMGTEKVTGKSQVKIFAEVWGTRLIGWILTAIAISLGAPFWFDILNKLMKLRGTGPKISTQTEQRDASAAAAANAPVAVNVNSSSPDAENA